MKPTYIVGIDLGTSHTVVAYAPIHAGTAQIALLPITQRITASEVTTQTLLPSVRYQAAPQELGHAWQHPWPAQGASSDHPAVIGRWAHDLGAAVPERLISSAKSWLSHTGVDRTAAILPWGASEDVAKISPLQASASYLAHIKAAWDSAHSDTPLHAQTVVLTVPASFDEGARALTLQAAQLANLPSVHLLEEPKAAFHDWLTLQGTQLATQLADSRLVLVVDVGGGTTDLTLIRIEPAANGGLPILTRTAVGEHLMLGGDNMDLALAHQLEPQFTDDGQRLPTARFAQLVQRCRIIKEQLLAPQAPQSAAVTLLGSGSKLLAQTRTATLSRDDVHCQILEGFLPVMELGEAPMRRHGALRGFGLPYPADAAISRHLAQFLIQQGHKSDLPDTVLLNGGVFHAHALAQRLVSLLTRWRGAPVRALHNPHPDWAVARGAVAYGLTLQPNHTSLPRITGGSARSYWLVLPERNTVPQGICLLPRGTPEGVRIVLSGRRFALRLGQAVRFSLVANSHSHAPAQGGQISALEGDGWVTLPPLFTVLPAPPGANPAQVHVQLQACMTETGTLEIRCVAVDDAAQSWLLPFAIRQEQSTTDTKDIDNISTSLLQARTLIEHIFGHQSQQVPTKQVRQLRQALEKILGPRENWEIALLRTLFDTLLAHSKRRRRSAEHERAWLNLAGWCLRPGVGAQLDGWRIEQVWTLYAQGVGYPKEAANWTEWWVFWRRVAAGLHTAQQMLVLEAVAGCMQKTMQFSGQRASGKATYGSYDDMLRLFAAVEAVPWQYRQEMGQWMLQRLQRPDESAQTWWAIGRLAARQPLAANAHQVMPAQAAQEFLDATLTQDWKKNETAMFAAVQIARLTGDRARDLPDAQRAQVLHKLRASHAPARWMALLEQVQTMDAQDQKRNWGDSLPPGLVLA